MTRSEWDAKFLRVLWGGRDNGNPDEGREDPGGIRPRPAEVPGPDDAASPAVLRELPEQLSLEGLEALLIEGQRERRRRGDRAMRYAAIAVVFCLVAAAFGSEMLPWLPGFWGAVGVAFWAGVRSWQEAHR